MDELEDAKKRKRALFVKQLATKFLGFDNAEPNEHVNITYARDLLETDQTLPRYNRFRQLCAYYGSVTQIRSVGLRVGDRVEVRPRSVFRHSIGYEIDYLTPWTNTWTAKIVEIDNEDEPSLVRQVDIRPDVLNNVVLQDGLEKEDVFHFKRGCWVEVGRLLLIDPFVMG